MRFTKLTSLAGMATLALLANVEPASAQRTITCESLNHDYNYCRVDTDYRVTVARELSSTACIDGRNWGYDRLGVWVDNGCRAQFRVGRGGDVGGSGSAVGAAATIAGIAILAAVLSNHKDDDRKTDRAVPSWAVGRFRGYNPLYNSLVELEILSSGKVVAWVEGRRAEGHWSDDYIYLADNRVHVYREANGFRTEDPRNRDNVVHYGRTP